jgi:hypothetical protein
MQPLDPNFLYEYVRLEECTPPNFTNFVVYRMGRPLVDPDAETGDCLGYHVHCLGRSLPQSPVRYSLSLENELSNRLAGRNEILIPSS